MTMIIVYKKPKTKKDYLGNKKTIQSFFVNDVVSITEENGLITINTKSTYKIEDIETIQMVEYYGN